MSTQRAAEATVAIVGGNAVVGRALELLLQGLGYRARFESGAAVAELDQPLAGAQLIVLAPGLSAGRRDAVLARLPRANDHGGVPVLEMMASGLPTTDGPRVGWPCRAEDLARVIDAMLGAASCNAALLP